MSSDEKGTCPIGGDWYTCTNQTPTFFGCCTSDPCNGSGCPSKDLRAAGMGMVPSLDPGFRSNNGSYWPNVQCSVGIWWTCAAQTPSFQGCCESNPCGGSGSGCPEGKLHPAAFQSIPAEFSPTASSKPSTPITTSTSLPRATSTTLPSSEPAKSHSKVPIIVGGVVGGVIFLLLIILVIFFNCRRIRKSQATHLAPNEVDFKPEPKAQPSFDTPESSTYQSYSPDPPNVYNDEAYYPGRPIFGVPHARKTPTQPDSPSPPSYTSPQPTPLRDIHEIHSNPIHEADGNEGMAMHGLRNNGMEDIAELEDRLKKGKTASSVEGVEKKEKRTQNHSRVGSGESYTSWQNFRR